MKSALIIPALNEAESIGPLIARIHRSAVDEIIVVDNGSTDGTGAAAEKAGARVVKEPRRGYGSACWAGLSAIRSGTEIVVFFDGDGSQRPEELASVLDPIVSNRADLVLGVRQFGANHPAHAVLGTKLVAAVISWRYAQRITDVGPFRAIRVELLQRLDMKDRAFGWPMEMIIKAAKAKARIVEVPVSHDPRFGGQSKVSGTILGSARAGLAFLKAAAQAAVGFK